MHSRRKFESATVDGAKSGRSLGEAGLGYFKNCMIWKKKSARSRLMSGTV
ncbi:MAG: hypothetical protein IPK68_02205 [Bdellovibrionales bacterium]|nr:hypothetical protein [Bdellovibrionales bacterium]